MKLQETRENVVAEQHEKGKAFAEEMRSLMEEVRATHPFAKMSEKRNLGKTARNTRNRGCRTS